jgi:hypothetical protein
MPKRINIVGRRFGDLKIVSDVDQAGNLLGTPEARRVVAVCRCGTTKIVNARSVRRGHTTSCGCVRLKTITKHGLSSHPLSNVWRAMMARCYTKTSASYGYCGAHGITVCKAWRESLPSFVAWALASGWKSGLQIDRIDNYRGYCPSNCRFVTAADNTNNRKKTLFLDLREGRITLRDAAIKYGISQPTLYQRVKKLGWDHDRAVSQHVR